jgi:hypothetical protein
MKALVLLLLPSVLAAQVQVRNYYDTFTAAGPLLDHVSALANGDVLYYDQAAGGFARIDPLGGVVWYERINIGTSPAEVTSVADAAFQSNGNIVLALLHRDGTGHYHPGLMRLNADGALLSAEFAQDMDIGLADWLKVAVLAGTDEIRMTIRGTGDGGTFHAFAADGTWQSGLSFTGNSELPVNWVRNGTQLAGANVGKLTVYSTEGVPSWSLIPGATTVGSDSYLAVIGDVTPIPIGYAFSFLSVGGTALMTPGIGLVSANGIFQGGIVFNVDELQGAPTVFTYPSIASTLGGLAMVANNGSSTDPKGYLFTCNNDLSNTQVLKVSIGDEAYPSEIVSTALFGSMMIGTVHSSSAGQRLIAQSAFGADMSSCFPAAPFSVLPFPMATLPSTAFNGTATTTAWTAVTPTLEAGVFSSDHLCGPEAVAEYGSDVNYAVYPVPAQNLLHIKWPFAEPLNVRVLDAICRMVLPEQILNAEEPLDISTLANGSYFLHITGSNGLVRVLPFLVE